MSVFLKISGKIEEKNMNENLYLGSFVGCFYRQLSIGKWYEQFYWTGKRSSIVKNRNGLYILDGDDHDDKYFQALE